MTIRMINKTQFETFLFLLILRLSALSQYESCEMPLPTFSLSLSLSLLFFLCYGYKKESSSYSRRSTSRCSRQNTNPLAFLRFLPFLFPYYSYKFRMPRIDYRHNFRIPTPIMGLLSIITQREVKSGIFWWLESKRISNFSVDILGLVFVRVEHFLTLCVWGVPYNI